MRLVLYQQLSSHVVYTIDVKNVLEKIKNVKNVDKIKNV